MSLEDVEWSVRDLIYRNHEVDMIISNRDILELLQKNYSEFKDIKSSVGILSILSEECMGILHNMFHVTITPVGAYD